MTLSVASMDSSPDVRSGTDALTAALRVAGAARCDVVIAVVGSTGLGRIAGLPVGRPASLLQVVAERPDQLVLMLAPRYAATTAREQADLVAAARPNARVDVVISDHHPLTLTLVADRALRAAERTGAADVTPIVEADLAAARSLVWCPSAWQLRGADLTLGQRLRALSGGPGFFLELGRRPWLGAARNGWRPRSGDRLYTVGPTPDLLTAQLGVTAPARVRVGVAPGAPYAARAARLLTALLPPAVAGPGSAAATDLTHESEAA